MPKLLLISERCRKQDDREVGDVVQWLSDEVHDKMISKGKLVEFDIVDTELSKAAFDLLNPQVEMYYKSKNTDWTSEKPEVAICWKDTDGSIKKASKVPRCHLRYENGQLKENFSRYDENHVVIINSGG